MIDFVRRSARWLSTAEYTYVSGVVWLGPMPVPVFRVTANDACQTAVLIQLWAATALLTGAKAAFGPLPAPGTVGHWLAALI